MKTIFAWAALLYMTANQNENHRVQARSNLYTSQSVHGSKTVHMPRKYIVPTHLNLPDQVLTLWSFSLSARELLLLLVGAGIGGMVWQHLARLYHSCLSPERALVHPLPAQLLSAVGLPSRVIRRSSNATHQDMLSFTGSERQWETSSHAIDNPQRSLPVPDVLHLVDLLAPECIEVMPDALRIGQEYACGLAVTACPREVFDLTGGRRRSFPAPG